MEEVKMKLSNLPDVLTISDLMLVLGIGKNSAYNLVNSGQLKSVRVGRKILISKQALMQFLGITEGA